MSTLHLVRHGQASFGSGNYDVLSGIGRRQSAALAAHWLASGMRPDRIYAGEMQRQRESARVVIEAYAAAETPLPPAEILPQLNEYSFQPLLRAHAEHLRSRDGADTVDGARLMNDKKAFQRFLQAALQRWVAGELCVAGVESWPAFKRRCVAGLERVIADNARGRTVAVFSSAGAIGAHVQHVLGLSDAQTLRLKLGMYNCGVTTLLYNRAEISLSSYNTIAHLERLACADLITYR